MTERRENRWEKRGKLFSSIDYQISSASYHIQEMTFTLIPLFMGINVGFFFADSLWMWNRVKINQLTYKKFIWAFQISIKQSKIVRTKADSNNSPKPHSLWNYMLIHSFTCARIYSKTPVRSEVPIYKDTNMSTHMHGPCLVELTVLCEEFAVLWMTTTVKFYIVKSSLRKWFQWWELRNS